MANPEWDNYARDFPTPAPEGETPPCQCGHALNQHLLAGGHCEQRGCACRLFVIPLPPARERGEEDDPEISRVVDRIALHASGRNCDCVDNTQCNAELDRATERAIEIVTRLTRELAEAKEELDRVNLLRCAAEESLRVEREAESAARAEAARLRRLLREARQHLDYPQHPDCDLFARIDRALGGETP